MYSSLPEISNWSPFNIKAISLKLQNFEWILAGGYALELFYGENYRPHGDIDIIIKRKHQKQLLEYFEIDRLFIAFKGELSPYRKGEFYEKPIQDIWVLSEDSQSWCLQIMLVDEENEQWIYKRKESIQLPFEAVFYQKEGIKVLKPEIQLLYKSSHIRPKDQVDFEKIYPNLSNEAKKWLKSSLIECYGENHKWIK